MFFFVLGVWLGVSYFGWLGLGKCRAFLAVLNPEINSFSVRFFLMKIRILSAFLIKISIVIWNYKHYLSVYNEIISIFFLSSSSWNNNSHWLIGARNFKAPPLLIHSLISSYQRSIVLSFRWYTTTTTEHLWWIVNFPLHRIYRLLDINVCTCIWVWVDYILL